MTDLFIEPEDATPLDAEERQDLLQTWIGTRTDLNEAEQANIDQAVAWITRRRSIGAFTDGFLFAVHEQMFGDVWKWAGKVRRTGKSVGIDARFIHVELGSLVRDVHYWIEQTSYPPDEIAVRFHHRLVAIHPFPNGNGRHARLMADWLIERLGREPFTWGSGTLRETGELRAQYIAALKKADGHDIAELIDFARS